MKYLVFILFAIVAACNSSDQKASTIAIDTSLDSLKVESDSLNMKLLELDTLASSAYRTTYAQIKELRQAKKDLIDQLETKYPNYAAIQSDDSNLQKIKELNAKLLQKEFEISQLKRKITSDSLYRFRPTIGQKLREIIEPEKPNENSLVIVLTGKVVDPKVSVYLVPYKGSSKIRTYEATCDIWYLNSLLAKRASYYNGEYFFNDIVSGKYVVKVCAYYGNWTIIKKKSGYQKIEIDVSPPIQ